MPWPERGPAGRRAELLGDDRRDQRLGAEAAAAVLARNRTRVAAFDQEPLPGRELRIGEQPEAAAFARRLCAMRSEKRAQLGAKRFVLGAVAEIHGSPRVGESGAFDKRAPGGNARRRDRRTGEREATRRAARAARARTVSVAPSSRSLAAALRHRPRGVGERRAVQPAICGTSGSTVAKLPADVRTLREGDRVALGISPPHAAPAIPAGPRPRHCTPASSACSGSCAAAPHGGFARAIAVEAARLVPCARGSLTRRPRCRAHGGGPMRCEARDSASATRRGAGRRPDRPAVSMCARGGRRRVVCRAAAGAARPQSASAPTRARSLAGRRRCARTHCARTARARRGLRMRGAAGALAQGARSYGAAAPSAVLTRRQAGGDHPGAWLAQSSGSSPRSLRTRGLRPGAGAARRRAHRERGAGELARAPSRSCRPSSNGARTARRDQGARRSRE